MGKLIDPKKSAEQLARLRSLGVKAAIVAVMLSGWLFFISQGRPVVPPETQRQAQKQEQMGPDGKPKPPEPSGSYVLSYTNVLMCVGLGLLRVTRTSNRRDRARPEQYRENADLVEATPEAQEKKT